ncbi:MAG: SDR family oxidoreductase [Acidimicrobiia bacterium]|nr:SDR family oxidoreductase [Acidimicrobiia bacterium]MDH4309161.1 SDR family oxidoreductase [Acidimicrobiia bacterium]
MTARFVGKVVLVTGASRGIGAATAARFAAEGARVVANYRSDSDGASRTVEEIVRSGGTARAVQADVGDIASIDRLVADVAANEGPIDVLVNNAASFSRSSFLDTELDELDQVLATNVRGLFYLSQAAARTMVGRGGAIVHVSSILARLAVPSRTAYCTSKGAVEALTRAMSLDLAQHGIRVNAVAPGLISTEALLAGMRDPEIQAAIQSHIPSGAFGEPEDIAAAVVFAASDDARYINGAIIPVDAGLGAREAGPAPRRTD